MFGWAKMFTFVPFVFRQMKKMKMRMKQRKTKGVRMMEDCQERKTRS